MGGGPIKRRGRVTLEVVRNTHGTYFVGESKRLSQEQYGCYWMNAVYRTSEGEYGGPVTFCADNGLADALKAVVRTNNVKYHVIVDVTLNTDIRSEPMDIPDTGFQFGEGRRTR